MVPIVEPEVLMEGDHTAEDCLNKTKEVMKKCFEELIFTWNRFVWNNFKTKYDFVQEINQMKKINNDEIANLTLKCLKDSVPKEVPGIAFLSGGQTEIEATENLNLINKYNDTNL